MKKLFFVFCEVIFILKCIVAREPPTLEIDCNEVDCSGLDPHMTADYFTGTDHAETSCGCTTDTLPHPRIVLLGPTGVGKSTFGNRLFGITEDNNKLAICSQPDANGVPMPLKFGVGHRTISHTEETSWIVGHYLGDPNNPCITIIDTPGTGDTEGRDCDHGIALAKGVKEIGSVDAFIVMFKGTNPRFSQPMQDQIHLYLNIFGEEMFNNAITEFSFWSHDKRSVKTRKRTRDGLDEEIQHRIWNKEYSDRMPVPREIPTIFIDPIYDEEIAEPRETEKYKEYTGKLWELITKNFTSFNCAKRCKAPSGFFNGQPWLFDENAVINKRPDDRMTITWQIWFAGCDGTGTKSYEIYFKSRSDSIPKVIYQHVVDDDDKAQTYEVNLLRRMKITDEMFDKFKTIRINVDFVVEDHYGEYFLKNDKGVSNISVVREIIDGKWASWGPYGECSKHCLKGNEQPGFMVRERGCIPPQNGGLDCRGNNNQTKSCAHRPGDMEDFFRQCPQDAHWSEWALTWGRCSSNCLKKGEKAPTQSRSRVCFPERFHGKSCGSLVGEAKILNLTLFEETRECSKLPNCPSPASLGPWSEWSQCAKSCTKEGDPVPQISRRRSCNKETLSEDSNLNEDVMTCQELGDEMSYKTCSIPTCPVPPVWSTWQRWSDCSKSCNSNGDVGRRHRTRSYTPGRYNAPIVPEGDQFESGKCNENVTCPVPATWQWGSWSSCDQTCYYPDGHRGMRVRENKCKEGNPRHQFLNCQYPPGGLRDIQQGCPGLPKCPVRVEYRDRGGCFGLNTLVTTDSGVQKPMRDLKIGDSVVSDEKGSLTKFVGWMELSSDIETVFLVIKTADGEELTLTGNHIVFYYKDGTPTDIYAKYLTTGMELVGGSGQAKVIKQMKYVKKTGYLDPLTESGTILSNNITTSCYASFPHHLANIALLPARMFPELVLDNQESQHIEGTRTYITIIKRIGRAFGAGIKRNDDKSGKTMSTELITTVFITFLVSSFYKINF